MTTHRARAGVPYEHQPMPVDYAGEEPTNSTLERDYEQFQPKVHKPEPGLISAFLGIFKKEWK